MLNRGQIGRKDKESGIPCSAGTKERAWSKGARRKLSEMGMVPTLKVEGLILYGAALFLSFYLLDVRSG